MWAVIEKKMDMSTPPKGFTHCAHTDPESFLGGLRELWLGVQCIEPVSAWDFKPDIN